VREPELKPRVAETRSAPPEPPKIAPRPAEPAVPRPANRPGQPSNYFAEAEEAKSLEEYVAHFHYKPPDEDEEVTMTGDRPVLDETLRYQATAPQALSDEPGVVPQATAEDVASTPPTEPETNPRMQTGSPVLPHETRGPDRSRFLDMPEPASEPSSASGTSTIGGPSFLGLSDAPEAISSHVADLAAEPPARSHWRAWIALIVLAIFGGLGYLEWRAEKSQTSNGPIGVMKMQIERLKGRKGAIVTPESTPEPGQPPSPSANQPQTNGSGPDMQVTPQQQTSPAPANQQPGGNAAPATDKPANPGAASTQPQNQGSESAAVNDPGGSAGYNVGTVRVPQPSVAQAPASDSLPAAKNAQPDNSAARADKSAPGAEELAKAADASDAAAASAWLWKSVAKGNSEAPVRLANMYIKGDGIPRSCEQAVVLLKSAAAKQNAAARIRLGSLYATGTCVPRDRVRAYQWMSSALEINPGATSARDFREQLWAQMTPQERELAQRKR
jgi:hypothetical protein